MLLKLPKFRLSFFWVGLVAFCASSLALATVSGSDALNVFSSGDVVSASQINNNFAILAARITELQATVAAQQAQIETLTGASSGLGTLLSPVAIYPGDTCENGGQLMNYGRDDNANMSLQEDEIDGSFTLCSGSCGDYDCGGNCGGDCSNNHKTDTCFEGHCVCGSDAPCDDGYHCVSGSCEADPDPGAVLYVADWNGYINICSLNGAFGDLEVCTQMDGDTTFWHPTSIALAVVNDTTYAYVADSQDVFYCSVDADTGALSACTLDNGGYSATRAFNGISIATIGGSTYAYIGDQAGHVILCSINDDTGALESCAPSDGGATGWQLLRVTIANVGGTNYAYAADLHGNVYLCSVNSETGALSGCTVSNGGASFSGVRGIAIVELGDTTYAYVAASDQTYLCAVNAGTGVLSSCASTGAGAGWEISVGEVGGQTYAYISAESAGTLCSVNTQTGALSGCHNSVGTGFGNNYGCFLQQY